MEPEEERSDDAGGLEGSSKIGERQNKIANVYLHMWFDRLTTNGGELRLIKSQKKVRSP